MRSLKIAVFEGDGIGPEVMAPTIALLQGLSDAASDYELSFEVLPAGAEFFGRLGESLPEASLARATSADAILMASMGLPAVRYPDQTEIRPQIDLRMALGLFAGLHPIRIPKGRVTRFTPKGEGLDCVIVRESTEGLFHSQGRGFVAEDHALETLKISRETSEALFAFAFSLARRRKARGGAPGRVTCVDKASVFRSFAFFRRIFDESATAHPDLTSTHMDIDDAAMRLVSDPGQFDVMVTENMFGEILCKLGVGLMGAPGLAPAAYFGEHHAVFQPVHGSEPKIAGLGWANPLGMILSAHMMLDWLGIRHGIGELCADSTRLERAVDQVLISGLATRDMGGSATTLDMAMGVGEALGQA